MERITGSDVIKAVDAAVRALERERGRIDALNVFPVPDGDTGTNMLLTARAAREAAGNGGELATILRSLAEGALRGARGNSGTILSQFIQGFSRAGEGVDELGPLEIAKGIERAVEAAYRAVTEPQEGTMLTVGRVAAERARAAADRGAPLFDVVEEALNGAIEALESTPELLEVLREAGVVDAGGEGLVVLARAAFAALKGEEIAPPQEADEAAPFAADSWVEDAHHRFAVRDAAIEFKYCTEFLIIGEGLSLDALRGRFGELGDSLVVVGDDALVKVHLHTNRPGRALEIALDFGDVDKVNVANMVEQNRNTARAHAELRGGPPKKRPQAELALAAVTWGDGFEAILRQQGVDGIIPGGETMNPSVGELVEAIDALEAPRVILLPNNKNVILSAQQAVGLTKKTVRVLPTTSLPQAVAATVNFDPGKGLDECLAEMEEAIGSIRVGEVTVASRSARLNGTTVNEGDVIGLFDGKIAACGKETTEVLIALVAAMAPQAGELITLYAGEGVGARRAEEDRERVAAAWPDCEVETYEGGQPLYTYWIAVE